MLEAAQVGAAFGEATVDGGLRRAGQLSDLAVGVADGVQAERLALGRLELREIPDALLVQFPPDDLVVEGGTGMGAGFSDHPTVLGKRVGAGRDVLRTGGTPRLLGRDQDEPAKADAVAGEADVRAAEQRGPGVLAGLLDEVGREAIDAGGDAALEPLVVLAVERLDRRRAIRAAGVHRGSSANNARRRRLARTAGSSARVASSM